MDLLVHDGVTSDQAANLALEEALARSGPPSPLLRIWQNESCVVIGRAQRAAERSYGIPEHQVTPAASWWDFPSAVEMI